MSIGDLDRAMELNEGITVWIRRRATIDCHWTLFYVVTLIDLRREFWIHNCQTVHKKLGFAAHKVYSECNNSSNPFHSCGKFFKTQITKGRNIPVLVLVEAVLGRTNFQSSSPEIVSGDRDMAATSRGNENGSAAEIEKPRDSQSRERKTVSFFLRDVPIQMAVEAVDLSLPVDCADLVAKEMGSISLIGRFLGKRPSPTKISRWMESTWKEFGCTYVSLMTNGFFVIKFLTVVDRDFVWNHDPWFRGRVGLLLCSWKPFFDPVVEAINWVPTWIRFYHLPLVLPNPGLIKLLVGKVGELARIDSAADGTRYNFERACVYLDISKPIFYSVRISSKHGSWLYVDFDGLPFKCFRCNKIGHMFADCSAPKISG